MENDEEEEQRLRAEANELREQLRAVLIRAPGQGQMMNHLLHQHNELMRRYIEHPEEFRNPALNNDQADNQVAPPVAQEVGQNVDPPAGGQEVIQQVVPDENVLPADGNVQQVGNIEPREQAIEQHANIQNPIVDTATLMSCVRINHPELTVGVSMEEKLADWISWHRRFDELLQFANIKNDAQKAFVLKQKIGKLGMRIIESDDPTSNSYDKIVKFLDKYFRSGTDLMARLVEIDEFKQRIGEAPRETLTRLTRALKMAGIYTEATAKAKFRKALLNQKVAKEAHQRDLSNEEVIVWLTRDSVWGKVEAAAHPVENQASNADVSNIVKPKCKFCNLSAHDRSQCPAREATCNNCEKKGHFIAVCRAEGGGNHNRKRRYEWQGPSSSSSFKKNRAVSNKKFGQDKRDVNQIERDENIGIDVNINEW